MSADDYTCPYCPHETSDPAEYVKHAVEHSFDAKLQAAFAPILADHGSRK